MSSAVSLPRRAGEYRRKGRVGDEEHPSRPRGARRPRRPAYRARVLSLLTGSLLLAGIIWGRLVYWQVVQHQRLSADALGQYSKVVELPATRGMIYDRNGQALAAGVALNKAESGSVLVMDPHTGAIIAWADYPTYNANNFGQTPVDRFIDPIASHLYEPG